MLALAKLLDPRVWVSLIVALAIAFVLHWVYTLGAKDKQAEWDREKLDQAQQTIKLKDEAKAKTEQLREDFKQLQREKDAQIDALNRNLGTAIAGLSNRPARDSEGRVPVDPSTGTKLGATGADLLRQDSEFLVRESARADRLRLQLIDCQAKYNKAADAVN